MINPYQILGFKEDINIPVGEIKKKYRQLCIENHPDKGGDHLKFKQINQAYRILSNEKLREKFHASLPKTSDQLKLQAKEDIESQDTDKIKDFDDKDLQDFNVAFEQMKSSEMINAQNNLKKITDSHNKIAQQLLNPSEEKLKSPKSKGWWSSLTTAIWGEDKEGIEQGQKFKHPEVLEENDEKEKKKSELLKKAREQTMQELYENAAKETQPIFDVMNKEFDIDKFNRAFNYNKDQTTEIITYENPKPVYTGTLMNFDSMFMQTSNNLFGSANLQYNEYQSSFNNEPKNPKSISDIKQVLSDIDKIDKYKKSGRTIERINPKEFESKISQHKSQRQDLLHLNDESYEKDLGSGMDLFEK